MRIDNEIACQVLRQMRKLNRNFFQNFTTALQFDAIALPVIEADGFHIIKVF